MKRSQSPAKVFADLGVQGGFTAIPNALVDYKARLLSQTEYALVTTILRFQYGRSLPYPSVEALADLMHCERLTIFRTLASLKEKALVVVVQRPGHTNGYDLSPLWKRLAQMQKDEGVSPVIPVASDGGNISVLEGVSPVIHEEDSKEDSDNVTSASLTSHIADTPEGVSASAPSKPKTTRQKMWDVSKAELGTEPVGAKSSDRGRWNKALASLESDGETDITLPSLFRAYREKCPDCVVTLTALAANRSMLRAKPAAPVSIYDGPRFQNGGYSDDEAEQAARREAQQYANKRVLPVIPETAALVDHRAEMAAMTSALSGRKARPALADMDATIYQNGVASIRAILNGHKEKHDATEATDSRRDAPATP
jgi:hypothetical protein